MMLAEEDFLNQIFIMMLEAMYDELPAPKKKR